MGISPDAFVQMAFQAAYYGLYGRVEPTYEPAMTKAFLHGRTEAVFSVTQESLDFVQTFWGDVSPAIKVSALRRACNQHAQMTKLCSQGRGHHRHLYALFCIWERGLESGANSPEPDHVTPHNVFPNGAWPDKTAELAVRALTERNGSPGGSTRGEDLPGIYADLAWEKMGNIVLSTSNCGNPSLRLFGFGPVSADGLLIPLWHGWLAGFGLGYIIKDNAISVCASSKHRQTARYVMLLQDYLNEIRTLLKTTSPKKARFRPGDEAKSTRQGKTITVHRVQPGSSEASDDEDTEMGGYGYFDVGSMAKLIRDQERKREEQAGGGEDGAKARRRAAIGRRLRLAEY
jgi:carnitine O-acetyltransferase